VNLEGAFLQDVLSNPDDVAPRLVFADWLDDRGSDADRDRAEFIRTQCELERIEADDPRRPQLERRTRDLLKQHRAAWTEPLRKAKLGSRYLFRRGFVEGLQLTADRFVVVAETLFALAPVRSIRFPYAVRETSALAASPHLARLTGADLEWMCTCGMCPIHDELHELYESPYVTNLTSLSLARDRMDAAEVGRLARSPHFARLTSLNLAQNNVGSGGIRRLAASHHLTNLTHLDLSENELTLEDLSALTESARFRRLKSLVLRGNGFGVTAARLLGNSENLAGLTALDLGNNRLGDSGAKALAKAKFLGNLTHLNLRTNGISREGAKELRERFGKGVKDVVQIGDQGRQGRRADR
jgi:uncharacterized protein (TIGR02996 family)